MNEHTASFTVSIDPETGGIYDRARALHVLEDMIESQNSEKIQLLRREIEEGEREKDISMMGQIVIAVAPVVVSKFLDMVSDYASLHERLRFLVYVSSEGGGEREIVVGSDGYKALAREFGAHSDD
jgi:hypothetical protein